MLMEDDAARRGSSRAEEDRPKAMRVPQATSMDSDSLSEWGLTAQRHDHGFQHKLEHGIVELYVFHGHGTIPLSKRGFHCLATENRPQHGPYPFYRSIITKYIRNCVYLHL